MAPTQVKLTHIGQICVIKAFTKLQGKRNLAIRLAKEKAGKVKKKAI
jgi:predicted LPLAT superfamily acyltransferase